MSVKLNQIVAAEKHRKGEITGDVTKIYHRFQKPALYSGFRKTYSPKDDDGDRFPDEGVVVQSRVEDDFDVIATKLTQLFDVTLTKDVANTKALGTVRVDGSALITAPVPFLLFLEKQLLDVRTMVSKVPVLDPSEEWMYDEGNKLHRTNTTSSIKTRKEPQVLVKYPATDKHAAQTEVYMKDVTIGTWMTTKFSGAISVKRRDDLIERVNQLITAVKYAVEEANQFQVEQRRIGEEIFDHLFGV